MEYAFPRLGGRGAADERRTRGYTLRRPLDNRDERRGGRTAIRRRKRSIDVRAAGATPVTLKFEADSPAE